jgi:hypothetical protein
MEQTQQSMKLEDLSVEKQRDTPSGALCGDMRMHAATWLPLIIKQSRHMDLQRPGNALTGSRRLQELQASPVG